MASVKTALVTGGARGIGFGIAKALVAEGYRIAVCGMRDAAEVADVIDELAAAGPGASYFQADVGSVTDRCRLVDEVEAIFGGLNLLVNNAGIAPRLRADILDAGEDSFEDLMRINLQGPYFLTQAVARMMIEQRQTKLDSAACIVNVTSISAVVASVNRGDYCISKAGLSMASKLWAVRLAEHGIPVYEIQPGIIATDMTAGVREKYDRLISDGLLLEPRWGTPEDIGNIVAALARGDIPYATGQVIVPDGGLTTLRL
ncbi:MAG TPA: 3-ketoacyl-ACP reductase [Lentisphaeria bacterium]|nr:3-ketoacyl-ACP reductase [Lentisphaeria bacterium]